MTELVFYRGATGEAEAGSLDAAGALTSQGPLPGLAAGWTHIVGVDRELLFYNAASGAIATSTLDPDGHLFPQDRGELTSVWTHLVTVEDRLLAYAASTGEIVTARLDEQGHYEAVREGALSSGWTHIAAVGRELLLYDTSTGDAQTGRLDGSGRYTRHQRARLPAGWTQVIGLGTELLFYNGANGAAHTGRIDATGEFVGQDVARFPSGYTHLVACGAKVLFYSQASGAMQTGMLDFNGHYHAKHDGTLAAGWDVITAQPRTAVVPTRLRLAVVPVLWADSEPADARPVTDFDWVFTAAGSGRMNLVDYLHDNSNGHLDISTSEVAGWTRVSMSSDDWSAAATDPTSAYHEVCSLLRDELDPEELDLAAFDRVVLVVPGGRSGSAGWSVEGAGAVLGSTDEHLAPQATARKLIRSLGSGVFSGVPESRCDDHADTDPYDVLNPSPSEPATAPWGAPGQTPGPGLNAASMFLFGWLSRSRTFEVGDGETAVDLRPLHHADLSGALCAVAGRYFISYRPNVRWDAGLPEPAVHVHEVGLADPAAGTGPVSCLAAVLRDGETWGLIPADGPGTSVTVEAIDDRYLRARVIIEHRSDPDATRAAIEIGGDHAAAPSSVVIHGERHLIDSRLGFPGVPG